MVVAASLHGEDEEEDEEDVAPLEGKPEDKFTYSSQFGSLRGRFPTLTLP